MAKPAWTIRAIFIIERVPSGGARRAPLPGHDAPAPIRFPRRFAP